MSIVFGSCEKHPNFSMANCPVCLMEQKNEAIEFIDEKIKETTERIDAGIEILQKVKEQLKMLKEKRIELELLKKKI